MRKLCFVHKIYLKEDRLVPKWEIEAASRKLYNLGDMSWSLQMEVIEDLGVTGPLGVEDEEKNPRLWHGGSPVVCLDCVAQAITRQVWGYPARPFETLEEYEKKIGLVRVGRDEPPPKQVTVDLESTGGELAALEKMFERMKVEGGEEEARKEAAKEAIRRAKEEGLPSPLDKPILEKGVNGNHR